MNSSPEGQQPEPSPGDTPSVPSPPTPKCNIGQTAHPAAENTTKPSRSRGYSLLPAAEPTSFNCPQCEARISAPASAFPGLCPVCRVLIEEPPVVVHQLIPITPTGAAPEEPADQPHAVSKQPVARLKVVANVFGDGQVSQRPKRQHPSGNTSFRPLARKDIPDYSPDFERDPDTLSLIPQRYTRNRNTLRWTLIIWSGILMFTLLSITAFLLHQDDKPVIITKPDVEEPQPVSNELREELSRIAEQTLKAVMTTKDPETIASHLIGGDDMIPSVLRRLHDDVPFPQFADSHMISAAPMSDEDIRHGICGLLYEATPPLTLQPSEPLLDMEQKIGSAPISLLEYAAIIDAATPPATRRALALFARNGGELLLEWELFVQTWDRTLAAFRDGELGDGPLRFRVIASFDKPVFQNGEFSSDTIVRLQDPLHTQDTIRVAGNRYDGGIMDLRNAWPHIDEEPDSGMRPKSATVDLTRDPETGRISIDRLVCMQFLDIGGKSTDPN